MRYKYIIYSVCKNICFLYVNISIYSYNILNYNKDSQFTYIKKIVHLKIYSSMKIMQGRISFLYAYW